MPESLNIAQGFLVLETNTNNVAPDHQFNGTLIESMQVSKNMESSSIIELASSNDPNCSTNMNKNKTHFDKEYVPTTET